MILGHYAAALVAKRFAPEASLGTLMAAAIFLDLVWPVFVILGLEVVAITPGATPVNPLTFLSYPWSHSLLTTVAWGLAFGAVYLGIRRYKAGAVAAALLVISHWLLDAVVHVPDLPLAPGDDVRIGLGVWRSLPATIAVELGLFAAGAWIYLRATSGRDAIGGWGFAGMLALMLVVAFGAIFGPPPSSAGQVAGGAMAQWLAVVLAAWIDRHRTAPRFAEP